MTPDIQDIPSISLEDVQQAAQEIKTYIHRTPVVTSITADEIASSSLDISLHLAMKCENLQKIGGMSTPFYAY